MGAWNALAGVTAAWKEQDVGSVENALTQAAIEYLTMRGCYVWRNNVGAVKTDDRFIRYGHRGSSDVIGLTLDGRMLCVEVKSQFGTVSAYQRAFLDEIRSRGGVGVVIRPADWQRVIDEALAAIGARP